MDFPIAGVHVSPLIPPLVAFIIAFLTSGAGLSGAFLLLPFQMSVLGFTTPAVTPTNLLYNVVAIPGGVYRYFREGRMVWPLTLVIIVGTLPGVFIGALVRLHYLPAPGLFKIFVGCVLLYIALQLLWQNFGLGSKFTEQQKNLAAKFNARVQEGKQQHHHGLVAGLPPEARTNVLQFGASRCVYQFWGEPFSFRPMLLFLLAFVVGIIGGIYGIGGGAIIAPFCVLFFALPVYTVAGAALLGTFLTSVVGILYFYLMGSRPDWALGLLFGLGGLFGTYCGARMQKFIPERIIRILLGAVMLGLASMYILRVL